MTNTQRTLKFLRNEWHLKADVVERWIPGANIRKDLFGFIDIVAVGEWTFGIQSCSYSGISARVKKIKESKEMYEHLLLLDWRLYVIGWHKVKNRWVHRAVEIESDNKKPAPWKLP